MKWFGALTPVLPIVIFISALAQDLDKAQRERVRELVLQLVESYNSGDSSGFRRDFSDSLLLTLDLEAVGGVFRDFRSSHGKIERAEIYLITREEGRVLLRFERGEEDLHIIVDQKGKIEDLQLLPTIEEGWEVSEAELDDSLSSVDLLPLENLKQFKQIFQNDEGKVRLVSILSPT